ncbi:hypothetical protein N2152v2_000959 [Parachlorella kessleri]
MLCGDPDGQSQADWKASEQVGQLEAEENRRALHYYSVLLKDLLSARRQLQRFSNHSLKLQAWKARNVAAGRDPLMGPILVPANSVLGVEEIRQPMPKFDDTALRNAARGLMGYSQATGLDLVTVVEKGVPASED